MRLTPYLKLRLPDTLTNDARYNLQRIDLLGATIQVTSSDNQLLRSRQDILLETRSPALGGSGDGGLFTVTAGTLVLNAELKARDLTTLKYLTISPSVSVDSTLNISLSSATVTLSLENDLTISGGSVTLSTSTPSSNVSLPVSGTLATLAGVETFSNKTISGSSNTFSSIPGSAVIPTFGSQVVSTAESLSFIRGSNTLTLTAPSLSASRTITLPSTESAGQVLTTDGSGNWSFADAGTSTLDSLTDVVISSPGSGDILSWNGANWVNSPSPGVRTFTWASADGTSKIFTHNLNTINVVPTLYSSGDNSLVLPESIVYNDSNSLTITLHTAPPTTGYTVWLQG